MSLIFTEESKCSICREVLKTNDAIISWTAFLNDDHKFWQFSDSGMHLECFTNWEYKEEFEDLYKYQPQIDFEDPALKEYIGTYGIPDWLKAIKTYRKHKMWHNNGRKK